MNPTEIEFAVRDLVGSAYDPDKFPYDLIGIYNASKMTVARLKSGQTNVAKRPGDVLWKKHLFFRPAKSEDDVGAIGDALAADPLTAKHNPRFILVTNGEQVHARDVHLDDTLNVEYAKLDEKSDFLLPMAGFERRAVVEEHPADIKAAKKLKKLYDAILAANPTWNTGHHAHELNLLITRFLFCLYSEDTGIFKTPKIFTNTVTQHTSEDGHDVAPLLDRLFRIMNIDEEQRPNTTPAAEARFPYVNGSLFEDTVEVPQFSRTARRQLLECGDLDWTDINPDIFGSMIQTIAQGSTRSDLGMHYTSVPNIMKVLQPLLLDDLHEAYEKAKDSMPKLEALLGRLSKIRLFDPACGSGNFLVLAYKEMRKLEIDILKRISEVSPNFSLRLSCIPLQHFFGTDIVDFACETAKLSLWIAEHQMNIFFKDIFGDARPTLPLSKLATIQSGNSTVLDWLTLCPPSEDKETFICGNPPYSGSVGQTAEQKSDIANLFGPLIKNYRDIDYVGCFFLKAAEYLKAVSGKAAFVATNSICQGEQVPMLWPLIFEQGIEIAFAYPSFIWKNHASHNAWVICVIIGLSREGVFQNKTLYTGDHRTKVSVIGPYLVPGTRLIIKKASRPLSSIPQMVKGNMPSDGGNLILSPKEKTSLIAHYPESARLIRPYVGSEDFINSIERYCLWIEDNDLDFARSIPELKARIDAVKRVRASGGSQARAAADIPHRFVFISHKDSDALIIPEVSAERRRYLQIGTLSRKDIASSTLYVIHAPPSYLLALLSSRLFRIWAGTVGGKMRHHTRVSNGLVYNTFPIPQFSEEQQRALAGHSLAIIRSRGKHPGKSIAWMYNPDTMPSDLQEIHAENDAYIEEHIYGRRFRDDSHRLEHLFLLYGRIRERVDGPSLLNARTDERAAS